MQPVKSSTVDSIGYDADSKTLHVRFKGDMKKPGWTYIYEDVDPDVYSQFLTAKSPGKFHRDQIRNGQSSPDNKPYKFTRARNLPPKLG